MQPDFQQQQLALTITLLLSLVRLVKTADTEGECAKNFKCYDCETWDAYDRCADPFYNVSAHDGHTTPSHPHVGMDTIHCLSGYCVKWHRQLPDGSHYFRRTCSNNITLRMPIALVCFPESRPATGQLCFCNHDYCNGATTWSLPLLAGLLPFILTVAVRHLGQFFSPNQQQTL